VSAEGPYTLQCSGLTHLVHSPRWSVV